MSKKKDAASVQIYARLRKLMPWEPKKISVHIPRDNVVSNKTDKATNEYSFQHVFNMTKTNEDMYKVMCKPMIRKVLEGYNGILIAYGQTGSGKTHTLVGKPEQGVKGVLPYSLEHLMNEDSVKKLTVSGCEAYGTHVSRIELFDLLRKENGDPDWTKKVGNTQIEPKSATSIDVPTLSDCWDKINDLHDASHFAPTGKNPDSSRGHAAFVTKVTQEVDGDELISYLVVVDLAGSEGESAFTPEFIKKVDSATLMARRLEAGCINNGLSQLQVVFNELKVKGKLSKVQGTGLRRILHSYINQQCIISVLFTLSPSANNATTTASTLKFAVQCGMVKVKPVKAKKKVNFKQLVAQLQKHIAEQNEIIEQMNDKVTNMNDEMGDLKLENRKLQKSLDKIKSDPAAAQVLEKSAANDSGFALKPPAKMQRQESKMSKGLMKNLQVFHDEEESDDEIKEENWEDVVAIDIKEEEVNAAITRAHSYRKTQKLDVTLLNLHLKSSANLALDSTGAAVEELLGINFGGRRDSVDESKDHVENIADGGGDEQMNNEMQTLDCSGGMEFRHVDTAKLNREELQDYCDELESKLIEERGLRASLEQSQQIVIDHLSQTNEALLKWFQMKKIL